ncbi:MAG: CapA family protein [Bacilli bacterium]|nr:CapA family protein [Bacilli bacterium]
MRKKRKLKKVVRILLWVVLFCFLISFAAILILNLPKEEKKEKENINYTNEIMKLDNHSFDRKFLVWIEDNYGEGILSELYSYLKDDSYDVSFWHKYTGNSYIVLNDLYYNLYENRSDVTYVDGSKELVSIGFAGDVSLADNWAIMPKYVARQNGVYGIVSENMVGYMKNLDWMNVNSEFAFSSRGSAMRGKQYTFRATPSNVSVYDEMGVDMVALANNHVYDYGQDAFYDTLSTLKNAKIPYIGAGVNKSEAESAYYLVINGYKISFLNATRAEKYIMTPEAGENSPGVFRCYDTTRLTERIKEEKEKSDYVVVIVHWGKETYHTLEQVQIDTGKVYIDSGADMVVGHHAHVLQGMEFYKGKLIAYNLGNFIFNSQTVDTGILKWELDNDGNSKYYFYPGLQSNCYTKEVTGQDAINLYNKMTNWSINANFLEDGQIIERTN